jgi:glycosyltransferase involved in cell wall biosynthesis
VNVYQTAYPKLSIIKIENSTGSRQGRIKAIASVLEKHKPDLVVAVNIVDVYAAARRVREAGQAVKVVMAIHAIAADLLDDMKREAVNLDAVICTNRLVERLCCEYAQVPKKRIFYAPYGVQTSSLPAHSNGAHGRPLRIAWVGRLDQAQKRVDDIPGILLELDRTNINYLFRLAGNGPDRARLLNDLQPWLDSGRVEYLGELPAAEVARYGGGDQPLCRLGH